MRGTNPMVRVFGEGPPNARCATCAHLLVREYARRYYKCALRKVTGGPATDHRKNWPACGKYQPKEGRHEEETEAGNPGADERQTLS